MASSSSSISPNPLAMTLEEFTIKKLDPERIEQDYRAKKKLEKKTPPPSLNSLIKFIIQQYREVHKHEFHEKDKIFEEIVLSESTWNPILHKGFALKVYICSVRILTRIGNMFVQLGEKIPSNKENSFLIFFHRTIKKTREIFALTRGTRGYHPVQHYTDYHFPKKIAYRLLDPEERSRETAQMIIGPVVTDQKILRSTEAFDPNLLHKIYTGFQTCLRRNASLLALSSFHNKGGSIPQSRAEVEIKTGGLRIHKTLPLEEYPFIFNHFSFIDRAEKTFCYQYPLPKRRRVEEDRQEDFAFLEYFTPVSFHTANILTRMVRRSLVEQLKGKPLQDWEFCHPHVQDYFHAHDFTIRHQRSDWIYKKDWKDDRISFFHLIQILRRDFLSLYASKELLERRLEEVKFGFRKGAFWDYAPLIACISGQMHTKSKSGEDLSFFKLNHNWFQISKSLIHRVSDEFKKMFTSDLLEKGDEGFLSRPWQPKKAMISLKDFSDQLKCSEDEAKELCNTKVRYITEEGKVEHNALEGGLLQHPVLAHFQEEIEELLKNEKLKKEDFEEALVKNSFAACVWEELTKERQIGKIRKAKFGKTEREVVEIQTPFLPKKHKMQKYVKSLQDLAHETLHTMDEGKYNEGYLYDVLRENKTPYKATESGWLPGDRICPQGIELFDVLHFPEQTGRDPKETPLFVYQVKEGFGQKTRSACSQLLNAARMIQEVRNGKTKILDDFYAEATSTSEKSEYRKKVKKQIMALGKQGFKDLFLKRKIVFVYAFVDDRKTAFKIQKARIDPQTFSVENFIQNKTEAVGKSIFEALQKEKILTPEGGKGEKFPKGYTVEEWKTDHPDLVKYKQFVWNLLAGDVSHFQSLIGRMDLLHTFAQIKGMGFSCRISQIPRPFQIIGDKDDRPSVLHWGEVDDEIGSAMQLEEETILFYRTPWQVEAEGWVKQKTLGDGSCAFHALLGTKTDEEYKCDPKEERKDFVDKLKAILNANKNGFTNPNLQKWYEANLKSAIEEADKPYDEENIMRKCAKMLLGKSKFFADYQKKKFYQNLLKKEQELIKNEKAKQSFWSQFTKNQTQESYKESLTKDEELLYFSFEKTMPKLKKLSKSSKTYKWLADPLNEIKTLKKEKEESKNKLLKSPIVMTNFLKSLEDPSYWLSDDELQMLAHIHGKRVEIIREDVTSGDFGCNNHLDLKKREEDGRPPVIIHGSQNHYSRCVPFTG
ncbi:MAG: hypothetical protein KR126chlam3_01239 [Chlamydiae bacterium]|nr:hypothetical protein [Chlamydiota bacterium]